MLAADKLQLQSSLKQQATALKEKEFNLHHSNLMTVGTQAAVLAGLDVTMFIEFQPPHNSEWGSGHLIPRTLKFFYYITIVAAFCANIIVVSQTTLLSLLGSSLALRGPDGSMITATDGLYHERKSVFVTFGFALASTVGAVIICVWLMLSPEASVVCMSITIYTCVKMYSNYVRVGKRFDFDEKDTVDFTDIFDGPANIQGIKITRPRKRAHKQRYDDYNMNGNNDSSDDQEMVYLNHEKAKQSHKVVGNNRKRNIPKPRDGLEYCESGVRRQNVADAKQILTV
mmetsp:Transcript_31945/g.39165  ORF Transcript_31945/g.39165 Transcript_31945/m.39165 type:complete len:285 (-) Transcript_31945:33-887(-)|eukprot:CAMPEP_0172496886 /NCGR_PEP_ID=MMETSP1066-20121228/94665_1 /TAXON_ID=671091 /ORGANISM="Coscinodiscus wailesii, Strain CCMP2513" /LENGTH=284 /DNA_ID=CAMNT_0013269423 /DNA_START=56 /DNA_END=910 /DNA_ORIENTATION=-